MTAQEIRDRMSAGKMREDRAKDDAITVARSLPAVLRDAGRENSAKEIERLLFVLDATKDEHTKFITENAEEILQTMLQSMRPPDERGGRA